MGKKVKFALWILPLLGAAIGYAYAFVYYHGLLETWKKENMTTKQDRYLGALLGLAAGDALGTTLEFKSPGSFNPLTEIVGGGPFGLKAGQWTDDTSMALCLAESLTERRGFDPVDQLERYVRWYRKGHLSSNGVCFDIGVTTRQALQRFERTHQPYPGSTEESASGNGSIMRLAPVPMAYTADPAQAVAYSGESSRTTHGSLQSVDACRYFGGLLVGALNGASKEEILSPGYSPVPGLWAQKPLHPLVAEVANGSFKRRQPPEIVGSGYVIKSLEAALWAFYRSASFEEGCLLAVNLGNDADTTGAVYGQLAGAFYGAEAIPAGWRAKLALREKIEAFAQDLYSFAKEARKSS